MPRLGLKETETSLDLFDKVGELVAPVDLHVGLCGLRGGWKSY